MVREGDLRFHFSFVSLFPVVELELGFTLFRYYNIGGEAEGMC